MRYLTLLLFLLLFNMAPAASQEAGYYVDNGKSITRVENEDPNRVQVEEWQVRLYKRGQATGGRDNWGLITGKSAAAVMKELQSGQDFERRYARFFHSEYPELLTYSNALGPIAVRKPPATRMEQAKAKIQELYSQVAEFKEAFDQASDYLDANPKEPNPFANVGSVLKEYVENLKDARKKLVELKGRLYDLITPSQATIDSTLTEIHKELDRSAQARPQITKTLRDLQSLHPTGVLPAAQVQLQVHALGMDITDRENWTPTVKDGQLYYTETIDRIETAGQKSTHTQVESTRRCFLKDLDADGISLSKTLLFNSEECPFWMLTVPTRGHSKAVTWERFSFRIDGKEQDAMRFDEDYMSIRIYFKTEAEARKAMQQLQGGIRGSK